MEQLWDFLRPWTSVLRNRIKFKALNRDWDVWGETHRLEVTLPVRHDFREEFGLEWSGEVYFQTRFQEVREALALLAAVAHVDEKAWKYLLVQHCGVNLGKEGSAQFERHIPVEFFLLVQHDLEFYSPHLVRDLVQFCGTDHQTRPTPEYLTTLAKIAALDTTLRPGKPGVGIVIPVHSLYPCYAIGPTVFDDILRSEEAIREMWNSAERESVHAGQLRCTFMLKPMVADLEDIMIWNEMATKVGKVMTAGLCFSGMRLPALPNNRGERLSRRVFGKMMARLFSRTQNPRQVIYPPALCEGISVSSQYQIELLKFECSPRLLLEGLHAMGSAMVNSQTTRKVVMDLSLVEINAFRSGIVTHTWWQWIAYAFFSKRARACSSLASLALVNIRTMCFEDMEQAFRPVVESNHPEELLFGCPRGSVDDRDAQVKADAPIQWQFDNQGQPVLAWGSAYTFSSPVSVRTFSDDGTSEWVNVMVPGFGRCQVERQNLEFREVSDSDVGVSSLTSLTLSFKKGERNSSDGVGNFLRLVGRSLKSLTLENPGPRMKLNERSILERCPNLEELSICGGMVDVLLDFRNFRPDPSQGRNIDWHNVVSLSRDLSDMNNPFVQCVRRLRVLLDNAWWPWTRRRDSYNPPDFAADVNSLVGMLAKNNRIEYVEVIVGERHKEHLAGLKGQHRKPIRRWNRLPTQNMIALLSVLSSRNLESSVKFNKRRKLAVAALYGIDRHVLSQIFAFAYHPAQREVYVRWQSEGGIEDEDDNRF